MGAGGATWRRSRLNADSWRESREALTVPPIDARAPDLAGTVGTGRAGSMRGPSAPVSRDRSRSATPWNRRRLEPDPGLPGRRSGAFVDKTRSARYETARSASSFVTVLVSRRGSSPVADTGDDTFTAESKARAVAVRAARGP